MAVQGTGLLELVAGNLNHHRPHGQACYELSSWLREFSDHQAVTEHLRWIEQRSADVQDIWKLAEIAAKLRGSDRIGAVMGLFVWSQVAGFGSDASGPMRLRAMIGQPAFEDYLLRVHEVLLREGAVAAHAMMIRGSSGSFSDLDQGRATGFLFFAGYGLVPTYGLQPLVLDELVGLALHAGEPSQFGRRCGMEPNTHCYREYLTSVEWLCQQEELFDYPPDAVARVLSRIGEGVHQSGAPESLFQTGSEGASDRGHS